MTPEQFQMMSDHISKTIKETVNGKIDKMSEKLDAHAKLDEETNRKLADYIESDMKWKEEADPYIKLASNISGTWKFLVYLITGVLVFFGLWNAVVTGIHISDNK